MHAKRTRVHYDRSNKQSIENKEQPTTAQLSYHQSIAKHRVNTKLLYTSNTRLFFVGQMNNCLTQLMHTNPSLQTKLTLII